MSLFRDIEKRIDSQLKKLFTSDNAAAQGRELIEIQRAILEEVEDRAICFLARGGGSLTTI